MPENTTSPEDYIFKQLETHVNQLQQTIDKFTENLIILKAEYSNEKMWVHNLLREHTTDIDKILDRMSRVEGRLNNGMNDAVVDLKQSIARLDTSLKELETRIREEDIRVEGKVAEMARGLSADLKEDKKSRNAGASFILMVIGQLILFIGLIYTLVN